ncbi:MAG: UDP-N-acetylmuramoyl-L-alanine--D-glutamate ligase [Candidatus Hydrogenedens sp.]|nr:UDP-N-acetylmuramoyl-L-alanine--D-glutamate ligase [Candidatus Hydrogenedens sp.]
MNGTPRDIAGKRVAVVGLGRTGAAAARLLQSRGAEVLVTDSTTSDAHQTAAAALRAEGIEVEIGGHSAGAFSDADLIVLSPGVPPRMAPLHAARDRGVPIISELELAWPFARAPIFAVTGTNGKTTTTELLTHLLRTEGREVVLAGNNDLPLSEAVRLYEPPAAYVVEVSSYQLESIETFAPKAAAVLNLTPDHFGRHTDMTEYARVKAQIFAYQVPGCTAIVNADDAWTTGMAVPAGVRRVTIGLDHDADWRVDGGLILHGGDALLAAAELQLPGRHNLYNVLAALALAECAGVKPRHAAQHATRFRGVEHRIEFVLEAGGVKYYNDSKSTNVDSLRVALESFAEPVVLIVGGRGKGSPYEALLPEVQAHVKAAVLIGEDAPALEAAWGGTVETARAESMDASVRAAAGLASPGMVVLLSPGCASFDWYGNFEERGRDFKACVQRLASPASAVQEG